MKILKGRAEIEIRLRTLGDVFRSEDILRKLSDVGNGAGELERKGTLAHLLSSTEAVQVKDDPHPVIHAALRGWQDMITGWKDMDATALWAAWCALPEQIVTAWISAYAEAQTIWERDPAWVPTESLTPAEKVEAAKPDSPLAANAKKSQGGL